MSNTAVRTKIMESRLEAREVQLHQLARLQGCGTWTLEPDTGELTCSTQCLMMLGLPADARSGFEALLDLVFHEDRPRVRHAFAHALRVRDEFSIDFRTGGAGHGSTWLRCIGRSHASALDANRHALSGILHAVVDDTGHSAGDSGRFGAMVERLEHLRQLDLRTVAARLLSEIAPQLTDLRQRVAALAVQQDLAPLVRAELASVSAETGAWLESLRAVLFEMLPPAVEELGFGGALERYASEAAAAAGIEMALAIPDEPLPLSMAAQEALYHAARAGIDNVVRHARAQHARVHVTCDGSQVVVTVEDDGVGIRQADLMKDGALRLFAESERLACAGGELRVNGRPGRGTVLEARIALPAPLRQREAQLQVA